MQRSILWFFVAAILSWATIFLILNNTTIFSVIMGRPVAKDLSFILRQYHDIDYANKSPAQKLDIYLPNTGEAPYPVIIAVHGGAFDSGSRADFQLNAPIEGVSHGYAVVSVDYRLSKEAKFPAAVQDVKAAIRFLRANAKGFNLDPDRMAIWGDSAGANIAALVGTSASVSLFDDVSLGHDKQGSNVQAVVDWFGPIDFGQMDAQFKESGLGTPNHGEANSPESRYLGSAVVSSQDKVQAANPETYIEDQANGLPPFLIEHGTKDDIVPIAQSMQFAKKLKSVLPDDKLKFVALDGAGHGGPQFETKANLDLVFAFLDKALKPRN